MSVYLKGGGGSDASYILLHSDLIATDAACCCCTCKTITFSGLSFCCITPFGSFASGKFTGVGGPIY